MADLARRRDDKCGCAVPCPGGASCRCGGVTSARTGEGGGGEVGGHSTCPCGAHCGCNPCKCGKVATEGVGRAACACGAGCNCSACKS